MYGTTGGGGHGAALADQKREQLARAHDIDALKIDADLNKIGEGFGSTGGARDTPGRRGASVMVMIINVLLMKNYVGTLLRLDRWVQYASLHFWGVILVIKFVIQDQDGGT